MKTKKLLKTFGVILLTFIVLIVIYILVAIILSIIEVKAENTTTKEVDIFILTNGVHTDLVLPISDWNQHFKVDSTIRYVSFGWGDKGFYLETPKWEDLRVKTALKAAFGLGTSLIHTTFYTHIHESTTIKKIRLSKDQYSRLIRYIESSFLKDENGNFRIVPNAHYGSNDSFYEARRKYSLFYTCNTWANSALKTCGQKAALWTPFDKGIFYHYNIIQILWVNFHNFIKTKNEVV